MNDADTTKKMDNKPAATMHDWSALDAMTAEEKHAAAMSDPDNPPLTEEDFKRMKRVPRAKTLRRALGLSQEEFAARFHIPIGTLRDWEQGRAEPDQAARAYLKVIATAPDVVRKALTPNS
ncbi:MAG: helix-turn-helix domain-containing protein [Hyphomicrobiaceae bacterium]